jgi:lincosamide nucleotidyltransferase A/C/D/E
MSGHVMTAGNATALLGALAEHEVDACVGGGWAVDALLGAQTREHADLDRWVPAADLERLFVAFAQRGVDRIFPWPGDRPWNFVLHLYEPRPDGPMHYGSVLDPYTFPVEALAGRGSIAGTEVRCESREWAVRWRTGYPPRPNDLHDVPLLCARFGIPVPAGF